MPQLYLFGGPNGAGKSTSALHLLPHVFGCREFVNADLIAAGLSPFQPESVALQAGRLMLERLQNLAKARVDFAFETTLASRSFVPFLKTCREHDYEINLIYLWLASPELAIERVAKRVRNGGHHIPKATIRRRYEASRQNFQSLYLPLATRWQAFDNSTPIPQAIARGEEHKGAQIYHAEIWRTISNASTRTEQVYFEHEEFYQNMEKGIRAAVSGK